jgi:hypothetical protein
MVPEHGAEVFHAALALKPGFEGHTVNVGANRARGIVSHAAHSVLVALVKAQ